MATPQTPNKQSMFKKTAMDKVKHETSTKDMEEDSTEKE